MPVVIDQRLSAGLRYIENNRASFNEEKKREAIEFLDSVLSSSNHIETKLEALFIGVAYDDYPVGPSFESNKLIEKAVKQRVQFGLADASDAVLIKILLHNDGESLEYIQNRRQSKNGSTSQDKSIPAGLSELKDHVSSWERLLIRRFESIPEVIESFKPKETIKPFVDLLFEPPQSKKAKKIVSFFYKSKKTQEVLQQSNLILDVFKRLKLFENSIESLTNPKELYCDKSKLIDAVLGGGAPVLTEEQKDSYKKILEQINLSAIRAKLIEQVINGVGIDKFTDLKKIADFQGPDSLYQDQAPAPANDPANFKSLIELYLDVQPIDSSDMHRIRNLVAVRVKELKAEARTKIRSAIDSARPEALRLIINVATYQEGLTQLLPPNPSFQWIEDTGSKNEVGQLAKEKLNLLIYEFNNTNPTIDQLVNHILNIESLLGSRVSAEERTRLTDLKNQAFESAVELRIKEHSPFGLSARPELRKILEDRNYDLLLDEHSEAFKRFLYLEQEPDSSKQLWLKLAHPNTGFQKLVLENKRLALLRAMHNTPLARVFADFEVGDALITISFNDINDINQRMNQAGTFSDFLQDLTEDYGDDSPLIRAINSEKETIEARFKQNKSFLKHCDHQTNSQEFKNLFLSLDVDFDYTQQHVKDLLICFATSKDKNDLIDRLSNKLTDAEGQRLIAALKKELAQPSNERFDSIQKEVRNQSASILAHIQDQITKDTAKIRSYLEAIPRIEALLKRLDTKLDTSEDAIERSLGLPFDRKVKENHLHMMQRFKRQLELVSKTVTELEEHLRHLSALPENDLKDPSAERIQTALDHYVFLKRYLETATKRIRKVADNESGYVFNAQGFDISPITDDKLTELREGKSAPESTTPTPKDGSEPAVTAQVGLDAGSSPLESRKLNDSQRHHLYTHKASGGSFVQTDSNARGKGVLGDDGIVSTLPSARVSLIKEPAQGTSIEEKLRFYMVMAQAMITARGGMLPTKEHPVYLSGKPDDMHYLYTAFAFLAKGDVKDVIKVVSTRFDPTTAYGFWGVKRDDLYKLCRKLFKDEPPIPSFANTGDKQDKAMREELQKMREKANAGNVRKDKEEDKGIVPSEVPEALAEVLGPS